MKPPQGCGCTHSTGIRIISSLVMQESNDYCITLLLSSTCFNSLFYMDKRNWVINNHRLNRPVRYSRSVQFDQLRGLTRIHVSHYPVQLPSIRSIASKAHQKKTGWQNNQPPILTYHRQILCIHAHACWEYGDEILTLKAIHNAFTS